MFYPTDTNRHGLAHDPFKAIVSPRPIGWIGTKRADGTRNLAPYSFFNAISDRPKLVMFASAGVKHSAQNAMETGVFTASLASCDLKEPMNMSSVDAPDEVDEFELANLTPKPGKLVDAPYVGEAYAALECRVTEVMRPKDLDGQEVPYHLVIGQVVGIHIREDAIIEGRLDMTKVAPLGRMGYMDYTDGVQTFEMARPKWQAG